MERIAVIGTGYVGLVAGAVFAANGHRVQCADVDAKKIARLEKGEIPIYEPGLDTVVKKAVESGALTFTTDVAKAIQTSTISMIAVGTPSRADGSFDSVYILSAATTIAEAIKGRKESHVVVVKSTIDPDIYLQIKDALKGTAAALAINPEFMAEGTAVQDFAKPNRVIIGTDSDYARLILIHLYKDFVKSDPSALITMRPESAIVAKLSSNAALAMKVAFINEIARFCDSVHADVEEVRVGMSKDPRVGRHFLYAGPGYGGSCFPKDVKALTACAKRRKLDVGLLSTVEPSNEAHKLYIPRRIAEELGSLHGVTIAVWGLAFKAGTDDVRESPALTVVSELVRLGAKVRVHDPQALSTAREVLKESVEYCAQKNDALKGARALVILTEWSEYKNPDVALLTPLSCVFDGRNVLDADELPGIRIIGIGRGTKKK